MNSTLADTRLIERWLPIAELGEESARERRSMTALPPTYYLHVWWARRPLVASRAAVLASLLPANADRGQFLHALGIHGDPVASRRRIDAARRKGERFKGEAYSYPRAFTYSPPREERKRLEGAFVAPSGDVTCLDPTAGGGSIPFETARLGVQAIANDLNPVAAFIMQATVNWPVKHGNTVLEEFRRLAATFIERRDSVLQTCYPPEPRCDAISTNYLWARTVSCPYCDGVVPLSPNWRLAPGGTGVRLRPKIAGSPGTASRVCSFEIVESADEQSEGTIARGNGTCPFPDCGRVIDGGEIKRQAQAGRMGEQLYVVVYKQRVETRTKAGKIREKWVRGYRAPRPEDDNSAEIAQRLAKRMPVWEAFDIVPNERFPEDGNDTRPIQYGMPLWRDLFSPRQLLCHGTSVEVFREMLEADRSTQPLDGAKKAAYGYLAVTLDTLLNYNNRAGRWDNTTGRVRSKFDRHDFAFVWSYAEMAPLVVGVGYDWAIEKTAKCIKELVQLVQPEANPGDGPLFAREASAPADSGSHAQPITLTCKPADSLDHIEDHGVAPFSWTVCV